MLRFASVGHGGSMKSISRYCIGSHLHPGCPPLSWHFGAFMGHHGSFIYLLPKNVLSSVHKNLDDTSSFANNYYYCCCYYHYCKLFHCYYHLSLRISRSPAMCSRPLYDPSSPWHMCIRQPLNQVTATPSSLSSITVIPVMR